MPALQNIGHRDGYEQFDKVLMGVLRRILDSNKRVQEAACSAFATLEEVMVKFVAWWFSCLYAFFTNRDSLHAGGCRGIGPTSGNHFAAFVMCFWEISGFF